MYFQIMESKMIMVGGGMRVGVKCCVLDTAIVYFRLRPVRQTNESTFNIYSYIINIIFCNDYK